MNLRESAKLEIDTMPEDALAAVWSFIIFQKHRDLFERGDGEYLASIPGMTQSIIEGTNTALDECVPLETVWDDV
ncbi:MAG: hypothetical protein LBL25_03945 [Oscillospiraceae bacterium]|jgi:hypothetical protein|nr:hypothetical protein [Oscillospiraceae bacterium]